MAFALVACAAGAKEGGSKSGAASVREQCKAELGTSRMKHAVQDRLEAQITACIARKNVGRN